jgi:toxin ParE1/3/4
VKIRFTPSALDHFLAALGYIQRDNPAAADNFRLKAEKTLSKLRRFPRSGRVLPEFPDLPYREVIVPPYRFFYRIREGVVWVVAVWHGAQLPKEPGDVGSN